MSHPVYGRVQAPEAPSSLRSLHFRDATATLKVVDHETPVGVLDQSDLVKQGIHTSRFIPGCKKDAGELGSCTANTYIEAMASILSLQAWEALCKHLINSAYAEHPSYYGATAAAERAAISFYYRCTHQTGDPAQEWPPTDCGSSGPYMAQESQRLNITTGQLIAHGADNLVSLLQGGGVMTGAPFFYSWEEPDTGGFIDGKGSRSDLEAAVNSGLAGGHEFYTSAIEKLVVYPTGHVDPHGTILRHRNHWTKSWGDEGCFRSHLSTWVMLGGECDHRRLVIA